MQSLSFLARQRSVQLTVLAAVLGFGIYAIAAPQVSALAETATQTLTTELVQLTFFLLILGVIYFLTRNRPLPNLAERAPERRIALQEIVITISYATIAMIVLRQFGVTYHPPNVFAIAEPYGPADIISWAVINSVVYALIPYLFIRWRSSTNVQLGLTNNNWRKDIWLVLLIGGGDLISALSYSNFLVLSPAQMIRAVPITVVLYTFGAGLPIVVLIQAILTPRIMRMTNSYVTTTILVAFAYAFFSIFDAGASFTGGSHAFLATMLILVHNIGPGLIKATLTVRTGNSWLHMLAFHVLSYHMIVDSPVVAFLFRF